MAAVLLTVCRIVYHWPAYRCLATRCQDRRSRMEFDASMSSSCSSKITSTFSVQTVHTRTTGKAFNYEVSLSLLCCFVTRSFLFSLYGLQYCF